MKIKQSITEWNFHAVEVTVTYKINNFLKGDTAHFTPKSTSGIAKCNLLCNESVDCYNTVIDHSIRF